MDMNLSKLQETVKDEEAEHNWATELNWIDWILTNYQEENINLKVITILWLMVKILWLILS